MIVMLALCGVIETGNAQEPCRLTGGPAYMGRLMLDRVDEPLEFDARSVTLTLSIHGSGRGDFGGFMASFRNRDVPLFAKDDLRIGQHVIGRTQRLRWEGARRRGRVLTSTRIGCGRAFIETRCADLRVGAPAYFSNVDTNVVGDGTFWVGRGRELRLFTRPGRNSRVSTRNVRLERVAERDGWTDLVASDDDIVIRGWARTRRLRRARATQCD